MNKKSSIAGLLACFFVCSAVIAQTTIVKEIQLDEVVISATKFKLKKEKVGKVIFKITQEDIQNNAGKTVLEVLNNIPGIEIKGTNSALGEVKGTYIRGGRNRQVLVLIDGVPLVDPTGISLEYDLRLLSLNQIESIEILKGASSTLYGAGAATGVINITLKKAAKNKIGGAIETSFGTNNSATTSASGINEQNLNASINGSANSISFIASIDLMKSDGLSAAKSKTNQGFSTNPFYSERGMFKLSYKTTSNFAIESFANIDNLEYSFDAGAYSDSKTNIETQNQVRFGVKPSFNYSAGNAYAIASVNKVNRVIFGNTYEGKSTNFELVNKWDLSKRFQLITGANYQKHYNQTTSAWGNINKDVANFNSLDIYVTGVYSASYGLNFSTGARLNKHSNYGNHLVYHINPSYNLYNTKNASLKLLTSYSTAFIAPSLYQLFSVYGNTSLNPETNKTLEFGLESTYKQWLDFSIVYFNRVEDSAIIFNSLNVAPWGKYGNVATTINAKGVETLFRLTPLAMLDINLGYTYTDKSTEVNYLPKNKATAQFLYRPFKNTTFSLDYKNVGERTGSYYNIATFSTVMLNLPSYQLIDINANYTFKNRIVTVFGTVSNLLNEDYEETIGYNTRGRNVRIGVKLQF
ncbi:MAG: TonB-dependent receptor [Flavobacteriaceae bacterium]|nr:TonB-dependent receptor [Flavobacteriaceae bacterium]